MVDNRTIKLPALPMQSDTYNYSVNHNPPQLGEHTQAILKELGYDEEHIMKLAEDKVIGLKSGMTFAL